MAVNNIKKIGSFSEDSISQALNRLDSKQQKDLEFITKNLVGFLGEKTKKINKKPIINSADSLFNEFILIKIRVEIKKFENLELNGEVEYNLSFDFQNNFNELSMEELKVQHIKIIQQETVVQNLDLVLKYNRGLLYLSASVHANKEINLKTWIKDEFGVSYSTAYRYMVVALLLKKFPRLLVCGLTFAQLLKHNTRIQSFLEKDNTGLREQLSQELSIKTQGKSLNIIPCEEIYSPKDKIIVDPDWAYLDTINPDKKTDDKLPEWINDQDDLNEKLYPDEEDMDLTLELEKLAT